MRIVCPHQKDKAWFDARLGKVTASNVWRALDTLSRASKNGGKGDPSGAQLGYMKELFQEIVSGSPVDHWVSEAMDKGSAKEPLSREEYAFRIYPEEGWTTGFVLHPTMDRLGCSPDYLVGGVPGKTAVRGSEFKNPEVNTHIQYLSDYRKAVKSGLCGNDLAYAVIPKKYIYQVQTCIVCCEVESWDWISSCFPDPENDNFLPEQPYRRAAILPPHMRWLQIPVMRDDAMIAEIEDGVNAFNERLLQYVSEQSAELPEFPAEG